MIAAGKKNRLKMKYPMKLWPFRPATRAGQNAIAIQMTANKIHQRTDMAASFPRSCERSHRLPDGSAYNDGAGPGCCAHHPGITLGGVIRGGGDDASPVGRGWSSAPLMSVTAHLTRRWPWSWCPVLMSERRPVCGCGGVRGRGGLGLSGRRGSRGGAPGRGQGLDGEVGDH